MSLSVTQLSVNTPSPFSTSVIRLPAITRRAATKQLLTQGTASVLNRGPTGDDEAQMPNEKDTGIVRAYTQVLCGKGVYSRGLSDTGMYHRMLVY